MSRPSFESIYMHLALQLAERSTCKRMYVGCVITTSDYQKVLSVGYNGNARGLPNCCDSPEPGKCGCIHAEANAVIKCTDANSEKIVFSTHQPCKMCAKTLVNLGGVKGVYFANPYRIFDGLYVLKSAGIPAILLEDI